MRVLLRLPLARSLPGRTRPDPLCGVDGGGGALELPGLLQGEGELAGVGEDLLDGLLADALHHGLEHLGALVLVLDERVALAHRTQADALLEVVHLVEVLAPEPVDGGDEDPALQGAHGLLAQLLLGERVGIECQLTLRVDGLDVAGELEDEVLTRERTVAAVGLLQFLRGDRGRVVAAQRAPQLGKVPLERRGVLRVLVDEGGDETLHEPGHLVLEVDPLQHLAALGVDQLALTGHDVVVLEDVLADLEVAGLHLVLGGGDGTGDDLGLQGHVLRVGTRGHDALGHARVEQPHEVVLHGQVEAGLARVPLTAGAATQLVVDAAGLVAFGAQHVEPAGLTHLLALGLDGRLGLGQRLGPCLPVLLGVLLGVQAPGRQVRLGDELGVAAQHDVGTTAGHVRGDRDRTLASGHRHDLGLAGVLLGVEDLVGDVSFTQQLGHEFGLLHRGRAHQDRLALVVALDDVLDDRVELAVLGRIDEVGLVDAHHGTVRGDRDDADLVGRGELRSLGLGGTGHAGTRPLRVEAEVVLEGDGGQRLVLRLDLHPFLRLDGLVHALVVAAPRQHTARVLVDDEDLAPVDDVVLVAVEQLLGTDGVVEEADEGGVGGLVEVLDAELVLDLVDTGLQDADRLLLLVDLVVDVAFQEARDARELRVPAVDVTGGGSGDDQRRAGLVDEDGVDLVDDDVVVAALDHVLHPLGHVVAQVVEAELVVRAVGDVGLVLAAAFRGLLPGEHAPDGHPEELVDATHQVGLVLGQVVVDGDHVHTLAAERPQVGGHGGDQGLALTGLHLGDVAQVQGRTTHDLDVEGALAQRAPRGLADGGEGLDLQVVEGLALVQALAELIGLGTQFLVGELLEVLPEGVDLVGDAVELSERAALACTEDLVDE